MDTKTEKITTDSVSVEFQRSPLGMYTLEAKATMPWNRVREWTPVVTATLNRVRTHLWTMTIYKEKGYVLDPNDYRIVPRNEV